MFNDLISEVSKRQAEHDQRTVAEQLDLHNKRNARLKSLGLPCEGKREGTKLGLLVAVGKGSATFESLKPKKDDKKN